MAKLGFKYLAGFMDADGSIGIRFQADTKYPQLALDFSQKTAQDEIIQRIHEEFGGSFGYMHVKGVSYSRVAICGGYAAEGILSQIRPYMVVKRHYADVCLDLVNRKVEKDEIPTIKAYLKAHRRERALPLPSHPSRRWLAGYFDGDGCVSVLKIREPSGGANVGMNIAAAVYDTEGIEIIHKQYGGRINPMGETIRQYQLSAPPSKVIEFFGPIWQHMVVKRDQAEFILRCAEMGHFRDGINIKSALKYLKAHPHRLNEPKPDVQALLATVRDLPPHQINYTARSNKAWETRRAMRQSETCVVVEAT